MTRAPSQEGDKITKSETTIIIADFADTHMTHSSHMFEVLGLKRQCCLAQHSIIPAQCILCKKNLLTIDYPYHLISIFLNASKEAIKSKSIVQNMFYGLCNCKELLISLPAHYRVRKFLSRAYIVMIQRTFFDQIFAHKTDLNLQ